MKKKISPSVMCADFFDLKNCIRQFEESKIDMLHVDIMDGSFVPNYTLGTDFVKILKANTAIPLDIHLMVENPESKLDWFQLSADDYVAVHCESTPHIHKAVAAVKNKGCRALAALNPGTPICALENITDDIDGVLVMTVDPGFAGQKLIPSALEKIKKLREYLDERGCDNIEIEVDGNVSFHNAALMNEMGANIFVSGTSGVFSKDGTIKENIAKLRGIISG